MKDLKQPFKVSENMELREAYNNGVDATLRAVREMVNSMSFDDPTYGTVVKRNDLLAKLQANTK